MQICSCMYPSVCLQVYHVRNKMDSVGLDMLLDIHGDEELPYNFINGNEVRLALNHCHTRLLHGSKYPVQAAYLHAPCSSESD